MNTRTGRAVLAVLLILLAILLLSILHEARAAELPGGWSVGKEGGMSYAAKFTSEGNFAGMRCRGSLSNCSATILLNDFRCPDGKDGSVMPLLVTIVGGASGPSASHVNGYCSETSEGKDSVVDMYLPGQESSWVLENEMRSGDTLTIIVPMADGRVLVDRLDLYGSDRALGRVIDMAGGGDGGGQTASPDESGVF